MEPIYVTGDLAVNVVLEFDPAAVGKSVVARPGEGLTINSPGVNLSINAAGDCAFSVNLDEAFDNSYLIVSCEGLSTRVPFVRASEEQVIAHEQPNATSN